SAALFQATSAGIDAGQSLPALADCEEAGLNQWDVTRNAGTSLAATQDCIFRLAMGPVPTPPAAPTNFSVTPLVGTNANPLDWLDAATNEAGYTVVRNNQTIATLPAQSTTFTDTAPPPGSACYSVVVFNSGGQAESPTRCVSATGTPPSAPANLRLT